MKKMNFCSCKDTIESEMRAKEQEKIYILDVISNGLVSAIHKELQTKRKKTENPIFKTDGLQKGRIFKCLTSIWKHYYNNLLIIINIIHKGNVNQNHKETPINTHQNA